MNVVRCVSKFYAKCISLGVSDRLYVLAFALGCASVFESYCFGRFSFLSNLLAGMSIAIGAIAFLIKANIVMRKVWNIKVMRTGFVALHVAMYFIAIIVSRIVIAKVIGLPPQDFDMTVGVISIFMYVAVLLAFVLVAMFLLIAVLMVVEIPLSMLSVVLNDALFTGLIKKIGGVKISECISSAKVKMAGGVLKHIYGAIGVLIPIMFLIGFAFSFFYAQPSKFGGASLVKLIAYVADYQYLDNYPGVDGGKKVRLHDNGVVSYAKLDDWRVIITIGKFN